MGRRVTTGRQARSYSFRLNPAFPEDADAIALIDGLLAQNWSTRQIMTDALLHADGRTPEMYSTQQQGLTAESLEAILVRCLDEYAQHTHRQPRKAVAEVDDDNEDVSSWTRNFAKGFVARQAQVTGDDDE